MEEQGYWELSYHGSARSEIRGRFVTENWVPGLLIAQAIDSLVLLKKAAKSKAIVVKGEGFIFQLILRLVLKGVRPVT